MSFTKIDGCWTRGRHRQAAATGAVLLAALLIGPGCAKDQPRSPLSYTPEEKAEIRDPSARPLTFEEEIETADRLRDSGLLPEAAWHYARALQLDTAHPAPRQRLGYLQLARDAQRSERIFLELVAHHPELASAHAGLGLARISLGDTAGAKAAMDHALALDPDLAIAHMGLGMLEDRRQRHEAARAHYFTALELDPRRYEIVNNIGMSLMMSGDFEGAANAFEEAIFFEPRDPMLYNNLGMAQARLGLYESALENLTRHASKADALNNLGYACMMNGDFQSAITYFERSLLEGPSRLETVLANLRRAETQLIGD